MVVYSVVCILPWLDVEQDITFEKGKQDINLYCRNHIENGSGIFIPFESTPVFITIQRLRHVSLCEYGAMLFPVGALSWNLNNSDDDKKKNNNDKNSFENKMM